MKIHHDRSQKGQALFEALFILLILMTLMFAVHYSGQLRAHSLALLGESSYFTFKQSTQRPVREENLVRDSSQQRGLIQIFTQQLLDVRDDGLIKVQKKQSAESVQRSSVYRMFSYVPIHRNSFLYVNAGNSHSALEAQSRIARSKAAWGDTADQTHHELEPHRVPLAKIDAPWGRGILKLDWLTDWAGQSPVRSRPRSAP